MRLAQGFGSVEQFMEHLKNKWTDFWSRVVRSIAEEEIRIRRMEIEESVGTHGKNPVQK